MSTIELAALGRPFSLGMLYDCRQDLLVPGLTLWDNEDLENNAKIRPQTSTEFEIVASESIEDKTSALNVDASLKASFLGGLVKVDGSAKYLNDSKTSHNQARVTLKYKATTKFQQLSMNHLGRGNVKHPDVFDSGTATHVVTGILYGAQAFFVFDRDISDVKTRQEIEGNLKAVINKIPTVTIDGLGSVKMEDTDIAKVEKFTCKFHGDFSLLKNPVSFNDAIQLYQSLPELLGANGENAVPLKVWLMPLKDLDSSAAQLVRQISIGLVREAQSVLEYFSELELRCNDALKSPVTHQFPQIGEKLKTFKDQCNQYKLEFQNKLAIKLPLIRGGGEEESVLAEFLKTRQSSPFNSKDLTEWMDCKEREINLTSSLTKMMKNAKIVSSNEFQTILLNSDAVCFAFTSLQTSEPYLSALTSYIRETAKLVSAQETAMHSHHLGEEKWYTSEISEVRKKAKLFNDFSEANKDNKNVQFLITSTTNESQRGASVYLYEDGVLANDNFQPPSKPEKLTASDTTHNSVTLKLYPPLFGAEDVSQYSIEYCVTGHGWHQHTASKADEVKMLNLSPNTEYMFRYRAVCPVGKGPASEVSESMTTLPTSPPGQPRVSPYSHGLSVTWQKPTEIGDGVTVERYSVEYAKVSTEQLQWNKVTSKTEKANISGLEPITEYAVRVSCECGVAGRSQESSTVTVQTTGDLKSFLRDLGLEHHYKEKLSLNTILQIDKRTITDEPTCHKDCAWHFLKKLMMVNVTARNVNCEPVGEPNSDAAFDTNLELENLLNSQGSDMIHPLDIVTALFLCSNGLLQQEIALKMSMCQFSIPLLLPNCETGQCQFLLWAMRDIIKRFRPHSLSDPKGFVEDRIVLTELPMVSFVRLGECSLSKSKILNNLLSNPHQYHETFVHRDMEGGDRPRTISDGLVEISWYLPCGNTNIDIFGEPVAIANLRGDIESFEKQYGFLCQTSAAVFVFFDNLDSQYKLMSSQNNKAQLFLVVNTQSKGFSLDALRKVKSEFNLNINNIILKNKQNDANFVRSLRQKVSDVVNSSKMRMKMENMTAVTNELEIDVDEEDSLECQNAKRNADAITSDIQDILKYKEVQLPLQGQILKELACLEKEEFRLKNAGKKNIENYKAELLLKKIKLREQQNHHGESEAMACFISALSASSPKIERAYFLKWMQMNLDNLSRKKLSSLREQFKEKCRSSESKDDVKELDRQISNSSLGIEHFLREMGQLYESAVSLPGNPISRQQLRNLPKLCAELLLEGFPMELVDGDASIIPLMWVTDVLTQLSALVEPKNKLLVVTVLGVQSTGKSTLLNTMFGVQFAVSSGRCTRGAFMLLVRVEEDYKSVLNCDFVLIIDTEGLKSPELAQLDNSYEHDNELATLVVGLSDVTIINIAMENMSEMKDVLQIVVHAFLRMSKVGKSPNCQFVHQNVSDVAAPDSNLRDRNLLLQQLNEMTQAAARMEIKEDKNFTDVMKYNPDTGSWYIPGLWHGSPPMAPVNAGYSEAVYEFKKNIIQILGSSTASANEVLDFLVWIKSLWNAVQHENFIFSFRNSLVADAYMKLCKEFSELEWNFKKHMYTWVTHAETTISNFGIVESNIPNLKELLNHLNLEALKVLSTWENKLIQRLTEYFDQKEGHVYLVEGYREDFSKSAKHLQIEIQNSVRNQLEAAVAIRKGMISVDGVKKTFAKKLEDKVLKLIEECRKSDEKRDIISSSLDEQFDELWEQTVLELQLTQLPDIDIYGQVELQLRLNLTAKGSHTSELLAQRTLQECGNEDFKVKPEGFFKRNLKRLFCHEDAQSLAERIIKECIQCVTDKVDKKTNYHDTYITEILHKIDDMLSHNGSTATEFDVHLKLHICGIAAREFQKMHKDFRQNNDPKVCLNRQKGKHCSAFKDLFNERDQCQQKADDFTNLCLRPAVRDYVTSSLGPEIVDAMMAGKNSAQFGTRTFFQYSLLNHLLSNDSFETYVSYIDSYQNVVQGWILDRIVEQFSSGHEMSELEKQHIEKNIKYITSAITNAQKENITVETFVQNICNGIGDKLTIPKDALETVLIMNNSNQKDFAHWLSVSVKEMGQTLRETFKESDLQTKLNQPCVKPQNELFNRIFGCGEQCPFCKVPCEAGGNGHTEHFAQIHRPNGLGNCKMEISKELVTDICSSLVNSEMKFSCSDTKAKFHPYKKYRDIYPNWKIQPDQSIVASDYWKYVMVKFNNEFAKKYDAKPADIPPAWMKIDKNQAQKSLDESFNIK